MVQNEEEWKISGRRRGRAGATERRKVEGLGGSVGASSLLALALNFSLFVRNPCRFGCGWGKGGGDGRKGVRVMWGGGKKKEEAAEGGSFWCSTLWLCVSSDSCHVHVRAWVAAFFACGQRPEPGMGE